MRVAFSSIAWNTDSKSPGDALMTRSTSEVAVCCSNDSRGSLSSRACCSRTSANSRVSALTCFCRSARVELAGRTAVGALLHLGLVVLPCCAGLRVIVRRRLTGPSHGPTTIHYHIMRSVVHHSKIRCRLAAMGHFRQIDPLPTLSACPLRSDRVRTFAPQRFYAVCQQRTRAVQQGLTLFDHLVGAGE